ncbi:ArsR/SmtB family transcription factor [[Clostridium] aminophilum]|uniref:ArsR family transcriptional regulator n=1 Tax=[Clostridium] aminophilum TaxID=1526 RepID=A0A1I6IME3_9FIRM|nr:metalloregulator ArsR/SmtB family transcription factor [[Clostridium] aminophilum]SET19416.1 ArsR family transcriptional regulator [[Clostridium] aminophilum]SFR67937.1 ArsR family transcriptional regulator [[Clostridium] aminophilum]
MEQNIVYDEKKIEHLIANVSEDELFNLAELFKVFADSTRIRILYDLFQGERNVTEICEDLQMNQSAVSHQLKLLKSSKLIQSKRRGKTIIYSLADEHVKTIIAMGKEHIEE